MPLTIDAPAPPRAETRPPSAGHDNRGPLLPSAGIFTVLAIAFASVEHGVTPAVGLMSSAALMLYIAAAVKHSGRLAR